MRTVSRAWARTITTSHTPLIQARSILTYQTGSSPTGDLLTVLDGEVEVDGTARIRSTLDLTVAGEHWPTLATDPLAPYGQEIYIRRGIQYSDSLVEYVGLGYFRVEEVERDEPGGPVRVTGSDRMAGIDEANLLTPRQFGVTASLGFIVSTLVLEVYPSATIVWDDDTDDTVLSRALIAEGSRYTFLDDLIRAAGKIWYWDGDGKLQIKSLPDSTDPVATIATGPGGALLRAEETMTRRGVYNAVVVAGEASDIYDPVIGVAIDSSPTSPTYFYGRFGQVPRFFSSPAVLSNSQAQAAAATMLRRGLGLPYSLDLDLYPNPALEPYDPVLADTPDRYQTHMLERLTIPLTPDGVMRARTREQSTILIGHL